MLAYVNRVNTFLAARSDVALALAVVGVLAILIFRVPPFVMDALIGINMAASALVLLVALYVQDAARLPSFPTILLLTTLFRLALNVSSTRLILLDGHAGEIIQSFGDFVVGGNFVVGGVVFAILVIVQFIVVAKGSERVAEVGARFSLDAMPGKQMAIDADLRAQLIDMDEARRRRDDVVRESKLYGAMDGAMKFVKGDAIAGIIISVVNIVAGIIIGVTRDGMPAADAAETYSLLTIGDGLVSQIPSILISVAAGLVVTRVASDRSVTVAGDITSQFTAYPRAFGVLAVVLAAMALVPGFPSIVFLVLAAVAGAVWWFTRSASTGSPANVATGSTPTQSSAGASSDANASNGTPAKPTLADIPTRPFVLAVGADLAALLQREPSTVASLFRLLADRRSHAIADLGVLFPQPQLQDAKERVDRQSYLFAVNDAAVAAGSVDLTRVYLLHGVDFVRSRGLDPESATIPWRTSPGSSIPLAQAEAARRAGLAVLTPLEFMAQHAALVMRLHAHTFLHLQDVGDALDALRMTHSDLVKAVTPDPLRLSDVTELLRRLLRDKIPIRDIKRCLESLAKHAPHHRDDSDELYRLLRADLGGTLCSTLLRRQTNGMLALPYYPLDVQVEMQLDLARRPLPNGGSVTIPDAELLKRLTGSVRAGLAADGDRLLHEDPVIVTSPRTRALVAHLLAQTLPTAIVLGYDELAGAIATEKRRSLAWAA